MAPTFTFTGFDMHDGRRKKEEIVEAAHRMHGVYPGWLQKVYFQALDLSSNPASCNAVYNYRHATIRIYSDFWDNSSEERWRFLLHEVAHTTLGPIQGFIDAQTDAESTERQWADSALEQSVQDVAESWFGYVDPPSWVTKDER